MDQETELIVKDFAGILEELTFNSKPIITTLTKIAEENIACAQYFVDALEARINKCVPSQKLFSFYALDSICKNAGSPYTIYFSKDLFNLYKKTYLLVDNATRRKLVSLFKTWLTPSESTGNPLFDVSALGKIQNFLVKASALHQKNVQTLLPAPTVPHLLGDIDALTKLTQQRLNLAPNDEKLAIKLQVLSQLKQELQREKLPQSALRQVQLQLKNIFAQEQQTIQQQLRGSQYNTSSTPTPPPLSSVPAAATAAIGPQGTNQQAGKDIQRQEFSGETSGNLGSNGSTIPLFENSSNSTAPPAPQGMTSSLFGTVPNSFFSRDLEERDKKAKTLSQMESIYKSLDEQGLLYKPPKESVVTLYSKLASKTQMLGNLGNNSEQLQSNLPDIPTLQNILFDCRAFFATKDINLAMVSSLQFDSRHLNAENSIVDNNLVNVLYRLKSNKCSACGKRFGNSPEERLLQANHLDWHFRINRRIKGTTETISVTGSTATQKNIQSRNWYIPDPAWIEFKDEDIVSTRKVSDMDTSKESPDKLGVDSRNGGMQTTETTIGPKSSTPGTVSSTGTSAPRRDIITVPESSEDMSYKCPICQDRTTAVYDGELGEWVWKNTVEVDAKFFHASCYREAARNEPGSLGNIMSV